MLKIIDNIFGAPTLNTVNFYLFTPPSLSIMSTLVEKTR